MPNAPGSKNLYFGKKQLDMIGDYNSHEITEILSLFKKFEKEEIIKFMKDGPKLFELLELTEEALGYLDTHEELARFIEKW